jgi:hypothetical protein
VRGNQIHPKLDSHRCAHLARGRNPYVKAESFLVTEAP